MTDESNPVFERSQAPERSEEPEAVSIDVLSGDPTAAELAALTAVITALVEEQGDRDADVARSVSGWDRSRRAVRSPLYPGLGAWRGFTG